MNPLVYEVTLDIESGAAPEFDPWLKQHVREMLALPGFRDARILKPEGAEAGAERRVVQYTLGSRAELDRYLDEHAPRMRAEGTQRFGEKLKASRRVFDLDAGTALPALPGLALAPEGPRCRNCGTPLSGKFCVECGQKNHTYVAPLWHVLHEFATHHFGFDTKFFHSIVPLLFRPGFLTREYCLGHEERYVKPFRMYLFCSIVFFFLAAIFWPDMDLGKNPANIKAVRMSAADRTQARADIEKSIQALDAQPGDAAGKSFARSLLVAQRDRLDAAAATTATPPAAAVTGAKPAGKADDDDGFVRIDSGDEKVDNRFARALLNVKKNPDQFKKKLYENLPKMMFVLMPLIALFLKFFYIGTKRFLTEHFVFTLHYHSMVFVVMLLVLTLGSAARHIAWLTPMKSEIATVAGWYMAIYLFLALRFFYRQSWLMTALKFFMLFISYFVALTITFVFGAVLTAAEI
ncbi:MAG TPA: DUF4286 family protein [Gammaproteobacteria bacterium]|jgi:hypothetical protein|nr:DUF4286 family protein [Gammaproteobacteria bacterium]